jgi:hypothetical protein
MNFVSTVQVLTVEQEELKSKKGDPYTRRKASCVLLNDAGEPVTVGAIRSRLLPEAFWETLKPGFYRAVFALKVPEWGDDKGDIVPVVTELTPVPVRVAKPAPAGA